jgi:uncharacterized membrane protein
MSDRRLASIQVGFATLGLGVATYLTIVHYTGLGNLVCANSGCATVQRSQWAEIAGIPVALLGLIGYVMILGSLGTGFFVPRQGENARLAVLGFTLIGFLFSAYLTYRELFSIHAICEWCASSAVILTILVIISGARFVRGDDATRLPGDPAGDLDSEDDPEQDTAVGGTRPAVTTVRS